MILKLLPPDELDKVCSFSNHITELSDDGVFTIVAECTLITKYGRRAAYIGKTSKRSMSNMTIIDNKGFVSYEGKRLRHYEENSNDYAIIRKEYGVLLTDNAAASALLTNLGDEE